MRRAALLIILILFASVLGITACTNSSKQYSCNTGIDCVSTCGAKCVNKEWAKTYKDPCVNVRAWDCSCEDKLCYSDGKPPVSKDTDVVNCDSYTTENCPEQCVVCPPCAECSSLRCQSEEFCKSIGFERGWLGR
ncbi:MAG: hypothetical protein V1659_03365 [Candidatus Woesearchaeota archaeon]